MNKKEAIEKVVKLAEAEVGYHEKKSKKDLDDKKKNSGSANYTKYAEWFDTKAKDFYNTKKNPCSWCDIWVDWIFCQCFTEKVAREMLFQPKMSLGAGCKYSAGYYRSAKAWHSTPEVGDQIFFGTKGAETHTGLVVKVTDKMVYTIEGNAENEVRKKSYQKSYQKTNKTISGYGRPKWSVVDKAEKPVNAPVSEKPNNSTPSTTKPSQGNSTPSTGKTVKASHKAAEKSDKYKGTFKVTVSALNMRDNAGKGNKILVVIPNGKEVKCDGSYTKSGGEDWLYVSYKKGETTYYGFCCGKYLK